MRAYFVQGKGSDYGVAIVAETAKEARNLAIGHDALDCVPFIEIEVKWKSGADVSGLKKGEVEAIEALRRGLYSYVMGDCPNCEKDAEQIEYEDGKFFCEWCRDSVEVAATDKGGA